jgi:UDP-glucuronate 4-epimerase
MDIMDKDAVMELFKEYNFDVVIHLAAKAGVRDSIEHPYEYVNTNILGFMNIIEACRKYPVKHFIYASSSSVYGLVVTPPSHESDWTDMPVSLYAATKKTDELIAHAYSKLYGIPCTGLRFFTVYGPYGRPDMAPMLFAKEISTGGTINVFNEGELQRDFTYIDDVVNGIVKIVYGGPKKNTYGFFNKVYNISYGKAINLMDFIGELEKDFNKVVDKKYMPMQSGDMYHTLGWTHEMKKDYEYEPKVDIKEGVEKFADWYNNFYNGGWNDTKDSRKDMEGLDQAK